MDSFCSLRTNRMIKQELKMGNGNGCLRTLSWVALCLGIICVLCVGFLADHGMARMTRNVAPPTGRIERHPIHQHLEIHYVNRRRVPNGPDPIHNRRASKARQAPGRS